MPSNRHQIYIRYLNAILLHHKYLPRFPNRFLHIDCLQNLNCVFCSSWSKDLVEPCNQTVIVLLKRPLEWLAYRWHLFLKKLKWLVLLWVQLLNLLLPQWDRDDHHCPNQCFLSRLLSTILSIQIHWPLFIVPGTWKILMKNTSFVF